MTIIQPPQKNILQNNLLLIILSSLILIGGLYSVYIYNQTVNFRYAISSLEKQVQSAQATNADLKNSLYQALDSKNLSAIADKMGLVEEKKPSYFDGTPNLGAVSLSH